MSGFRNIKIYLQRWNGARNVSVPGVVNIGQMLYHSPHPAVPYDITRFVVNKEALKPVTETRYGLFDFAIPSINLELSDMDGSISDFITRPTFYDLSEWQVRTFDQIYVVTIERNGRKKWRGFFRWEGRNRDIKNRKFSVKVEHLIKFLDETFENQRGLNLEDHMDYDLLPDGAWTLDELIEHIQARRPIFSSESFDGAQSLTYLPSDNWSVDEERVGNYLDVIHTKCKAYGIRPDRNPTFKILPNAAGGWKPAQWYYSPETKLKVFEISGGEEVEVTTLDFPSSFVKDLGVNDGIPVSYIQNVRFCLQNYEDEKPHLWVWTRKYVFVDITIWRINVTSGNNWRPDDPFTDFNIDWKLSDSGEDFCRIHDGRAFIKTNDSVNAGSSPWVRSWPGRNGDYRQFTGDNILRSSPNSLTGYGGTSGGVVMSGITGDAEDIKDGRATNRIWAITVDSAGDVHHRSDYYGDYEVESVGANYWARVGFPWDCYYGKKPTPVNTIGKTYDLNGHITGEVYRQIPEAYMPYRYTWYHKAKMWLSGVCLDKYAGSMIELLIDCAAGANCDIRVDYDNNLYFVRRDYGETEWTIPDRNKENITIEDVIETDGDLPELSRIEISDRKRERIREWYRNVYLKNIRARVKIPIKLHSTDENYPVAGDKLNETIDGEAATLIVTRSEYDIATETVNLETVHIAES